MAFLSQTQPDWLFQKHPVLWNHHILLVLFHWIGRRTLFHAHIRNDVCSVSHRPDLCASGIVWSGCHMVCDPGDDCDLSGTLCGFAQDTIYWIDESDGFEDG